MKDYWNALPSNIKGSKKRRFNYLMSLITREEDEIESSPQISPEVEPELSKYNISFSVKDNEDNGVGSASVTLGETTKTTGSAGGCSFQDIEEGEHTISVTADGFEDYSDKITVSENNTSFEIVLTDSE